MSPWSILFENRALLLSGNISIYSDVSVDIPSLSLYLSKKYLIKQLPRSLCLWEHSWIYYTGQFGNREAENREVQKIF